MNIDFANRRVIVTGAGHGFGRAIAHGFAERGARVWGCDINTDALAVTLREAPKSKTGSLTVHKVDVTDRAGVAGFPPAAGKRGAGSLLINAPGRACRPAATKM